MENAARADSAETVTALKAHSSLAQEVKPLHPGDAPCLNCAAKAAASCDPLFNEFGHHLRRHQVRFTPIHRTVRPRRNIYVAGESSESAFVICSGWACRMMRLPEGRRQILSFLLPGDQFSATAPFRQTLDFHVEAITKVHYAAINSGRIKAMLANDSLALECFVTGCIAESTTANQTLADLGQRSADEKIAVLILRLMERLGERGLVQEQAFQFPLRQQHIADAVGLTTVHVSRIMGMFRKSGVFQLHQAILKVLNLSELRRIASMR